MEVFPKVKLVVSACLSGERKRYDGKIVTHPLVEKLKNYCDFILFCPETGIGLPVPRDRTILLKTNSSIKAFYLGTKEDITEKVYNYYLNFKKALKEADGFLLKAKSPSCGISPKTKTYSDENGEKLISRNKGILADFIIKDFAPLPIADEYMLKDNEVFEDFFTRLFLFARLRASKTYEEEKKLTASKNLALFLLAYNPSALETLGGFERVFKLRPEAFDIKMFPNSFSRSKFYNAFLHLLNLLKPVLSSSAKKQYQLILDKFVRGKKDLIQTCNFIKSLLPEDLKTEFAWFLNPYPEELRG